MRARLTRQAQRDFDDAIKWFGTERPWLVDQLRGELKNVFELLLKNPEGVVVKPFSYVVAYFISGDVIVVASISHSSRDWISRLTDQEF
jgi:plasmid stabilization system protein ParE